MDAAVSIEDIIRQGFIIVRQVNEKGLDVQLEESFSDILSKIQKYSGSEPLYISTLLMHLKCAFDFTVTLKPLKPSVTLHQWFTNALSQIEDKICKAAATIEKNEKNAFSQSITEALVIHEQILSLQISLFITDYVENALKDLSAEPANLADFYSTIGLLRSYLPQITEVRREPLENIIHILCYIRYASDLTQDDFELMHKGLKETERCVKVLFNPLTSLEVAKDVLQEAKIAFETVKPLIKKVQIADLFDLAEEAEVERFAALFNQYKPSNIFTPLFTGHSCSLITFSTIKKYKSPDTIEFILLSATVHAINTARDYWNRASEPEQELLFQDLKAMAENLMLYFENRIKRHKPFSSSMQHLANQAITHFKEHYKNFIKITNQLAPNAR